MRKLITIMLITAAICTLPAAAESQYSASETKGLRIDGGAGVTGSIHSTFLTVNPEIMYDLGVLAAGIGVNNLFGLTFQDIYTAPYIQLELLWFYLAGGAVFELKGPEPNEEKAPDGYMTAADEPQFIPYIALGADFIVIPIGSGGIGIDLNAGIIPTATPVQIAEDQDSIIGKIVGSLVLSGMSAVVDSVKVGASIYYSHTF